MWFQVTGPSTQNFLRKLFSEDFDAFRVSTYKKVIHKTQYIQFLRGVTVQVWVSLTSVKSKLFLRREFAEVQVLVSVHTSLAVVTKDSCLLGKTQQAVA